MLKRLCILGAMTLGLAACGPTPEQITAYKKSIDEKRIARCEELGFEKDTEAFANCRLKLETQRAATPRVVIPAYPYPSRYYYHHPYFTRYPHRWRYW